MVSDEPTLLYLDTAQWMDLAEGRADGDAFEAYLAAGAAVVVLSFAHVMDLANGGPDSRQRVAAYIDRVVQEHSCRWIRGVRSLVRAELREAFLRRARVQCRPFPVFVDTLVDALDKPPSWEQRAVARGYTVAQIAREVAAAGGQRFQAERKDIPRQILEMRESRRAHPRLMITEVQEAMAELFPSTLTTDHGIEFPITRDTLEWFLEAPPLMDCRSLRLRLALNDGWAISQVGVSCSELEDWAHTAGVAYSSVAFVDGRTHEALRRAGYTPLPMRNAEFPEWLRAPGGH